MKLVHTSDQVPDHETAKKNAANTDVAPLPRTDRHDTVRRPDWAPKHVSMLITPDDEFDLNCVCDFWARSGPTAHVPVAQS